MTESERCAVRTLLQYLADKNLTNSWQFRDAVQVFGITIATLNKTAGYPAPEKTYFVDIHSPESMQHPPHYYSRHYFHTEADARRFIATQTYEG